MLKAGRGHCRCSINSCWIGGLTDGGMDGRGVGWLKKRWTEEWKKGWKEKEGKKEERREGGRERGKLLGIRHSVCHLAPKLS